MNNVIHIDYTGKQFDFREDGWFNATLAAERFGKRPVDWLRLPETERYLEALCKKSEVRKSHFTITQKGNSKKFTQGTWLHPKLAVPFARWLDLDFSIWCDEQIDNLIRGKDDWRKLRHEAASSYKVMCNILHMTRERIGKTSKPHTFSNEARLINWALTGEFGKVDRESLSDGDLDLLAKLEQYDTVFIGCGKDYEGRKAELESYANSQRSMPVAA